MSKSFTIALAIGQGFFNGSEAAGARSGWLPGGGGPVGATRATRVATAPRVPGAPEPVPLSLSSPATATRAVLSGVRLRPGRPKIPGNGSRALSEPRGVVWGKLGGGEPFYHRDRPCLRSTPKPRDFGVQGALW